MEPRNMYDAGRKTCLALAEDGYVDAFEETLSLMERNREICEGAYRQKPKDIKEDSPTMSTLIEALRKSDEMERQGSLEDSYSVRIEAGTEFESIPEYHWLAEYFYRSGYRVAEAKDVYMKVKALKHLGLLELELKDNADLALRYIKKANRLIENSADKDNLIKKELNQCLLRINWKLGEEHLEDEPEKTIQFFKKAVSLARSSDTLEYQAVSHALLGRVLMKRNRNEESLMCFEMYLQQSEEWDDTYGTCTAYFALSEVHKRMGSMKESRESLSKCQKIARENSFLLPNLFSSISFGQLETAKRRYSEAQSQFETAYSVLQKSEKTFENRQRLQRLCRCMCGVGRAHLQFKNLMDALRKPPDQSLAQLLAWKRSGCFEGSKEKRLEDIDLDAEENSLGKTQKSLLVKELIEEELNQGPYLEIK